MDDVVCGKAQIKNSEYYQNILNESLKNRKSVQPVQIPASRGTTQRILPLSGSVVYNGRHYHYSYREKTDAATIAEDIVRENKLDHGALAPIMKQVNE